MNSRAKKIILQLLAPVFLLAVAPLQRALNRDRAALGLTRVAPLENAPPVLAFTTVALGGFRGLIANALWIRMSELQDEDKFFEMQQLADWITKLEPHFSMVWTHQAWNMAYNISVKFKDSAPGEFPDRWRWVKAGIELLRDEGLRYNPHDVAMHQQLAWLYQHKMGANLDDANMYYKTQWAHEMARVFGDKELNLDELISPATDDARRRQQILTNEFKLDPVFMKHVNQQYGPLEWRLPEAHAIYWAAKGLDMASNNPTKIKADDLIQLNRVIYQSMQTSFRRGRLVSNPFIQGIETGPNLAIIPTVNKAYEEALKERGDSYRANIEGAHRNFLRDGVIFLYHGNHIAEAESWYKYLVNKYPNKSLIENDPNSYPTNTTLEQFVLAQIGIDVTETDRDKVKARIEEFLFRGYIFLIRGNDDLYAAQRLMARNLRRIYMGKISGGAGEVRIGLPPVEETEKEIVRRMLDPNDEVYGLPPEMRAILRTDLRMEAEPPAAGTNAPPASAPATNSPAATPGK